MAREAYTLEQLANQKNEDAINYYNLSIPGASSNGDLQFAIRGVLDDYINELTELSVDVTLTNDEVVKYQYKPWLLSHDLYGDSELWFVILLLNGLYDQSDFDRISTLKLIKKDVMAEVMNNIMNNESAFIRSIRDKLNQS